LIPGDRLAGSCVMLPRRLGEESNAPVASGASL
jgi:hypothetical protein